MGADGLPWTRAQFDGESLAEQAEAFGVFLTEEKIQVGIVLGLPVGPALFPIGAAAIAGVLTKNFVGRGLARRSGSVKDELRAAFANVSHVTGFGHGLGLFLRVHANFRKKLAIGAEARRVDHSRPTNEAAASPLLRSRARGLPALPWGGLTWLISHMTNSLAKKSVVGFGKIFGGRGHGLRSEGENAKRGKHRPDVALTRQTVALWAILIGAGRISRESGGFGME
jgi:hypothetical protein